MIGSLVNLAVIADLAVTGILVTGIVVSVAVTGSVVTLADAEQHSEMIKQRFIIFIYLKKGGL